MLSTGPSPSSLWSDVEVAVPRRSVPRRSVVPPGVSMAGFRQRAAAEWDISMVAHPSVTLLVDLSDAAHLLAAGRAAAGVAAESGYADQSHLHRETIAFTGLTPAGVAVAPWLAIDDVAWPAVR